MSGLGDCMVIMAAVGSKFTCVFTEEAGEREDELPEVGSLRVFLYIIGWGVVSFVWI